MPSSLTDALFGPASDDATNDIFIASSELDQKIERRRQENQKRVADAAKRVDRHRSAESTAEVLARRRKQSQDPLVEQLTIHSSTDDSGALPAEVRRQERADIVDELGVAVVKSIVGAKILELMSMRANVILEELGEALSQRGIDYSTQIFRFDEVASRCTGRIDTRYTTTDAPFNDPSILDNPTLRPLIDSLLGSDSVLVYAGLIYSFPESADQPWHQDGEPLFPEQPDLALPPYALNVFVPLSDTDTTLEAGPTEFVAGSHGQSAEATMALIDHASGEKQSKRQRLANDTATTIIGPLLSPGDALLYDYRVCHRGTTNLGSNVRRLLYLVYARPWFREHVNFGTERLFCGGSSDCTSKTKVVGNHSP